MQEKLEKKVYLPSSFSSQPHWRRLCSESRCSSCYCSVPQKRPKIGLVGLKIRETKNNCKSKVEEHLNVDLNHIIPILKFLSFSDSQGPF